jgi:hypothetical protein
MDPKLETQFGVLAVLCPTDAFVSIASNFVFKVCLT